MRLFITGMHRSGTSLLASLVGRLGYYLGAESDFNPADHSNPKGYWENKAFLTINERLLAASGAAWDRPHEFSCSKIDDALWDELVSDAKALITEMDQKTSWALKDPRLCITLPFWKGVVTDFSVLVMVRSPLQVAESLRTRDAYPLHFGVCLWEYYTRSVLEELGDFKVSFIDHASLFNSAHELKSTLLNALYSVGAESDLDCSSERLQGAVDENLFRAKVDYVESHTILSNAQIELVEKLNMGALGIPTISRMSQRDLLFMTQFGEFLLRQENNTQTLSKVLSARDEELVNAKQEIDSHKSQSERLKESNKSSTDYIKTLELELKKMTSAMAQDSLQFDKSLRQREAESTAVIETLNDELSGLDARNEILEQSSQELTDEVLSSQKNFKKLEAYALSLQLELSKQAERIDQLNVLVDEKAPSPHSRLSGLQEEYQQAKMHITDLERTLTAKNQDLEEAGIYVRSLEEANRSQTTSLARAAEFCASLEREIEKITNYSKALEAKGSGYSGD